MDYIYTLKIAGITFTSAPVAVQSETEADELADKINDDDFDKLEYYNPEEE